MPKHKQKTKLKREKKLFLS